MKYIVSACLVGKACKYDAGHNRNEAVIDFLKKHEWIALCPENLAGLGTPRPRTEIQEGTGAEVLCAKAKVINEHGEDVSAAFVRGAQELLHVCQSENVEAAILKARSPSCGFGTIYDGSFSGRIKKGNGVSAEVLWQQGIAIQTEEDIYVNE